jgi:DNA-binding NarL/FixJ family response regulator
MNTIRIAIFEDNNDLRDSLAMIIESVPDFELAGSFSNAQRLIPKIEQSNPDLVLMDINMPGISGIEAVAQIHALYPQIKIMMQTVFDEDDKVFASLCAGASGYILKNTEPERVMLAIKEVAAGGAFFTPSIALKVLSNFQQKTIVPENINLTEREKQVLQYLVDGLSYKMIADTIFLSYETVHSHIKKIYEKLHVNSKSEAVVKALRNKLV